jgi:hypothetical protein
MNITTIILLVLAGIIALLLLAALFMRKKYGIRREIIINVPRQKAFDYLKQLKNQDNFNKWVMVEPDMKREFKGTDGTVGFIYGWNGKKAGEGQQEIKAITEGKKIETEIRFVRPFSGVAQVNLITESVSEGQTKVSWSNESEMKYPLNAMISMLEKMLAKDMDTSLSTLKNVLEDSHPAH